MEREGIQEPPEQEVAPVAAPILSPDGTMVWDGSQWLPYNPEIQNALTGYSLGDQLLKSILEDMWSCR